MIPKVIHYCWFGRNPKPELANKCIKSWKKLCPDYEIVEWNEDNFDISSAPLYVRQAYEAGKWAFVTDYARLKVVYDHGGIYLDTDVELIRSFTPLLQYAAFFGYQNGVKIATGLGFGAEQHNQLVKDIMMDYEEIPFIREDGSMDDTPCPERNTEPIVKWGLRQDNSFQVLEGNIAILPKDYLSPKDYISGKIALTTHSYAIHHFSESWKTDEQRRATEAYRQKFQQQVWKRNIRTGIIRFLGEQRFQQLKSLIKRS